MGGAPGIAIGVAGEAIDIEDRLLLEFAELALALFGPSLGEALAGFEPPAIPLPELAFDLNGDGTPESRLEIRTATLLPVDTTPPTGGADWICILADLVKT